MKNISNFFNGTVSYSQNEIYYFGNTVKTFLFLQEVAEYYSKHAQSPQRWHTPQIIQDLKVCKDIYILYLIWWPHFFFNRDLYQVTAVSETNDAIKQHITVQ